MASVGEIDRELAASALKKRSRGESPTRDELRALKRLQGERDAALRAEHYKSIPKKDWQRWSGRQQKVINEQAQRYKLPLDGPTIDLAELAPALHDFLARNAAKLAEADGDMEGESTPALERFRTAKAILAELEIEQKRETLVPRQLVHETLIRYGLLLRNAGEVLQRRFGEDARQILDNALNDCDRVAAELAGDVGEHGKRSDDPL